MYRSNDFYRTQIFEEWFTKHTTVFEMMRDGKICDTRINIEYAPFIKTFNSAFKTNMRHYDSRTDCYSDCMAILWEGMLKFEIKNDSTWEAIANRTDIDNYKKLVSYLKTYVSQNMKRLNQECAETTRIIREGKNKKVAHIFYNIAPDSLNQIITFDNSLEQVELLDTVQKSYWEEKFNYRYGIFAEWARDNMRQYLTESQKKLLELLQSANYSSYDNDYDKEMLGTGKGQIKLRLERICDKVSAKYEEEQKLITGGYVIQEIDAEIKAYQKFVNVLNDTSDEKSLIQVIISSLNNKYWERLIYEDITDDARYDIIWLYQHETVIYEDNFKLFNNASKLFRSTLYEVVNAISKRIEYLMELRVSEFDILHKEASKKKVKTRKIHFELPKSYNIIYLKVNPFGIMLEK